MIPENVIYDISSKEKDSFSDEERFSTTSSHSRLKLCCWLFPVVTLVMIFVFSVVAVMQVHNLKDEMNYLQYEVHKIRRIIIADDDLYDDIKKFENEAYPDVGVRGHAVQPWFAHTRDGAYQDYDVNYGDDYDSNTKYGKIISESSPETDENIPDHEDLTNLLKGGTLTKIGKETRRSRRNVIAATQEGAPVTAERSANMKKNKTSSSWLNKHYPGSSTTNYEQVDTMNPISRKPPVISRKSRVYNEEKTRPYKAVFKTPQVKSGSHFDSVEEQIDGPEITIIRDDQGSHRRNRHKQRNNLETLDERPKGGRTRLLPAIHFNGDTSKYVLGRHTNFNGDGHLRHPDKTYVDWAANDWVKTLGMDQYFQMQDGYLKIKEHGLYFVYAQIYYLDEHDTNGFRVHKNQDTILQCTTMTHSNNRVIKGNTCYTAGVEYLNEGDQISLRDLADGRYSLFEEGKSFFGVVKLGDVKIK